MAYTNLKSSLPSSTTASFNSMMTSGFGIVTVMNAKVYAGIDPETVKAQTPYAILEGLTSPLCTIDTLKVANVTMEGPNKTVTGGRYSNPLIKFGKSARLEMQDALGRIDAIQALGGGISEWTEDTTKEYTGLHFGENFEGPKTIVGETFFIDQKTGKQIWVNIIFYQFLPDSIFNLTQDAEGDATVFDMNGDLLTTEVQIGGETVGVFYSIVEKPATTN